MKNLPDQSEVLDALAASRARAVILAAQVTAAGGKPHPAPQPVMMDVGNGHKAEEIIEGLERSERHESVLRGQLAQPAPAPAKSPAPGVALHLPAAGSSAASQATPAPVASQPARALTLTEQCQLARAGKPIPSVSRPMTLTERCLAAAPAKKPTLAERYALHKAGEAAK
jgi:hypothetical protein